MLHNRELEAFTKFGSDLDAATQAKLNRGRRTVEVLKQPVHEPLTVEKQVVILYALTHGFLDSVPVDDILRFQEELFDYFEAHYHQSLRRFVRHMIFQQKKNWMQPLLNLSTSQISNRNRSGRWQFH